MKNDNYLERIAIALETLVGQGNSLSAEFEQPTVEEPKGCGRSSAQPC